VIRLLENEKFQEMVINHLVKLTQDLTEFKQEMIGFKQEMTGFKQEMTEFKQETKEHFEQIGKRLDRLEQKQDIANDQIAELLEFKTDATPKLDSLLNEVKFLKHKEFQHEEDIFFLKNHLKVIK
jgi:peptidoglycan hydrolase CwlO-like protein